ncbi:MAG: hypothetical protein Ta2A_22400 [Treponemataceae bacterium]|nr:MAG: hypothetical protein Ta2A_22400 [Treponemataceae bacterium]
MAIIVEHTKRKREILEQALDIFESEGYENVTFQKIADKCRLTRTTLYLYFNDKHEIFVGCVRELTVKLEKHIHNYLDKDDTGAKERLCAVTQIILDDCIENRKLFAVLLDYIILLHKKGKSTSDFIRRRMVRLKHIFSALIIEGVKSGEFKQVDIKAAGEILYALTQAAMFRLAVMDMQQEDEMRKTFLATVDGLVK